ncbi:MAG: hypothetical protein AAGD35_18865 [Actinomycetota bacterium]
MTTHHLSDLDVLRFRVQDHATYLAIGAAIWLVGVVLVRALGPTAFDTDEPWPILLYLGSIALGVATQLAVPVLVRRPMAETLVPVMVMCGGVLAMDGIAIGFTDIYAGDAETKMVVGGWLLWTFGTQILVSVAMIGRAARR